MKRLGILFLSLSTTVFAQSALDFLTGQAARETIGQGTFTAESVGSPSPYQIGASQGIAYANNTLFIVDSNLHGLITPVNNRVLIYNNISRFIYNPIEPVPQGGACPVCVGTPSVGEASLVLGQPNFTTTTNPYTTQSGFRNPTMVASDGNILVLADTDNNRVLIWNSIPNVPDQPADIVLGQANFTTVQEPPPLNSSAMRGPQGVWIQGTQLYVADTQNHRVLIWNNIPTSNNQPADLVLGEPNFSTAPPATTSDLPPTASNLFSPVSVTSDGKHVFVTDLGHNRVLIWNSIPTQNGQAADVVVGQQNMTSELDNGYISTCVATSVDADGNLVYGAGCPTVICPSTSTDSNGTPLYPSRCGVTMSIPRYALSDGTRLFVADSGNDRVLVYDTIPATNGARADIYLGQPDEFTDQVSSSTDTFRPDANILESAPNTTRTPYGLAWDGANLYVSDPFDVRVLVFTPGSSNIPITGITNAANQSTYAVGTVSITGTITTGDTVSITITSPGTVVSSTATGCQTGQECYTYTVVKSDTLVSIVEALANAINGVKPVGTPDPNVVASANIVAGSLFVVNLIARQAGLNGNNIGYAATTASVTSGGTPTEAATAAGSTLAGGAAAEELAPGTLVTIFGNNLADSEATPIPDAKGNYPTTFNGVQVYFDGIRSPILYVKPTQINVQLPYETEGTSGVSAVVRTVHNDGSVTATTAIGVPVISGYGNPGIFAGGGNDPRPALAYHTGYATALVDIDGSITAGDVATLTINGNNYSYVVQSTDTLQAVRDGLIALINANVNDIVTAAPAGEFTRIVLTAKVGGPAGNNITISATVSTNATITLSPLDSSATCCANIPGSLVTQDNPVVPGEVITIYATGIGPTTLPDGLTPASITGQSYPGPAINLPVTNVDNAQVGGTTANVLSAGLAIGMLPGIYEVVLQIDNSLPTNPQTQVYIAQNVFTSNIVTIPVVAQVPPSATSSARKAHAH